MYVNNLKNAYGSPEIGTTCGGASTRKIRSVPGGKSVVRLGFVVRALVRWAKGERLTNRLPSLSLITLSPPWNGPDFTGRRATTRGSNFWGSRRIFQIADMRKPTFL